MMVQPKKRNPGDVEPGAPADPFTYYERLRRVKQWLDEHYAGEVNVRAAARVAGLNETYFSRFFCDKTGVRFSDWVNATRVERAMQRIRARNHSITEVAFDVGYRDLRTFERVFKRLTGMTPRAYRNTVRPDSRTRARGRLAGSADAETDP